MDESFGEKLRYYRRQCTDPVRGGPLTQERLAELLGQELGTHTYTGATISNWEQDKTQIPKDPRLVLVKLIKVLHDCHGLQTAAEADALLWAGDYRPLNANERRLIFQTDESDQTAAGQLQNLSGLPIFMAPALPPQGVLGRSETLSRICDLLMLNEPDASNVPPVALQGMGGIGKTTLATALCHQPIIAERFPEGVLWVALGPNPTSRVLLDGLGRALGVDLAPERDENACRDRLRAVLFPRRVLLIVDDVWDEIQGQYFMVAGPGSRTIISTRESLVAHVLTTRERTLKVDVLKPEAALTLLRQMASAAVMADEPASKRLCERLEFLPLALTLAGRLLANEADVPSRMQRLVSELIERRDARLHLLQAEGRLGLDEDRPVSLQAILAMSVERLSALDQERFAMLSVFGGEPLTWKIDGSAHVWECPIEEAEATISHLVQRGLVERRGERYWMHALLADYAADLMGAKGL